MPTNFPSKEWMPTSCQWWRACEVSLSAAGQPEIIEWKVTVLGVFVHAAKGGFRIRWKSSPEARQRVTEGPILQQPLCVRPENPCHTNLREGEISFPSQSRSGAHLKAIIKGHLIGPEEQESYRTAEMAINRWADKNVEYIFLVIPNR